MSIEIQETKICIGQRSFINLGYYELLPTKEGDFCDHDRSGNILAIKLRKRIFKAKVSLPERIKMSIRKLDSEIELLRKLYTKFAEEKKGSNDSYQSMTDYYLGNQSSRNEPIKYDFGSSFSREALALKELYEQRQHYKSLIERFSKKNIRYASLGVLSL